MDLSLTPEQLALQQEARRFVREKVTTERLIAGGRDASAFDPVLWKTMAQMGWFGLLVGEDAGGAGASHTDAAVLFEELGRGPVSGPMFETAVLAVDVLSALRFSLPAAQTLLPMIADGDAVFAVVLGDFRPAEALPVAPGLSVTRRDETEYVHGSADFVREAMDVTHYLVLTGQDDGPRCCVIVDAAQPGITREELDSFSPRQFAISFSDVAVAPGWSVELTSELAADVAKAIMRATPVLGAFQVGSCQRVLELSVDYSGIRRQFGRPIGAFQRVQDHIIELVNALDTARWTTYHALWRCDEEEDAAAAVHVAKAVASEAHWTACNSAHEVHAGLGADLRYGLSVHTYASRTLYDYLGDPRWHRRRLAGVLGLAQ